MIVEGSIARIHWSRQAIFELRGKRRQAQIGMHPTLGDETVQGLFLLTHKNQTAMSVTVCVGRTECKVGAHAAPLVLLATLCHMIRHGIERVGILSQIRGSVEDGTLELIGVQQGPIRALAETLAGDLGAIASYDTREL